MRSGIIFILAFDLNYKEKEDVADDWGRKLSGEFVRRHYWWIARPFAFAMKVRRLISPEQTGIKEREARRN
jgi:hypothetical protein